MQRTRQLSVLTFVCPCPRETQTAYVALLKALIKALKKLSQEAHGSGVATSHTCPTKTNAKLKTDTHIFLPLSEGLVFSEVKIAFLELLRHEVAPEMS